MSSGPSTPATKTAPPSTASAYSQAPSTSTADSFQKRSGSSGSFGAGASTRRALQARGNQPLRKQHKAGSRARLADEDAMAESAAIKAINSRKGQTSITHLMNFALPPRPYFQHHHSRSHPHQRRNPTWGLGSGYHAIDKARYVHANYRFIVRADREYHAQTIDADVHVGWDAVLQILASAETQSTSCPICLSTPVAPRMAKCGHIFCLPCMIRYMHSTDDLSPVPEKRARWKKCPICEDSIYISETRPVRWFVGQEASMLQEGGDVLLKLVMREPGTTLALPRDAAEGYGHQDDIPWYNVAEIMDYARFMKGGESYMNSQYNQEISALEAQEKEDELMFGDDNTWSKKAVAAINDAKAKVQGIGDPSDEPAEKKVKREPIVFNPGDEVPEMYTNRSSPGTTQSLPQRVTWGSSSNNIARSEQHLIEATNTLRLGPSSPRQTKISPFVSSNTRPPNHPFFFYHALPNFFLSPLDIRILKVAFGNFSSFPSTILPRVEHISTGHIVDDDLRKRAKYMTHLPYGCEVTFIECDWTDIIPRNILDQFRTEIERRRKRNHEKEAREERERIRAEKDEDEKRWAAARRKRPSFVEKSFSEADFQPLSQIDQHLGSSPTDSNTFSTTPPWRTTRTHSSFVTLASPGTSPDAPRTVWGTAMVHPSSPALLSSTIEPSGPPPDDGWLQDWEKDLLDQDDAVAIVEASINGEGSSRNSSKMAQAKKKKNKKITLMSTNVRRGA